MNFEKTLQQRLAQHASQNLYRTRLPLENRGILTQYQGKKIISFCSNDYLGLSTDPKIINALAQGAEKFGVGGGASQLICGYKTIHQDCEQAFAQFFQRDRALLFPNGHTANLGVISALLRKKDHAYLDKLNHASLIDGVRLSGANLIRYNHCDAAACEKKINSAQANTTHMIITESVFSMEGDFAPLSELAALANNNQAALMLDDAHGAGIFGKNGAGRLSETHLSQQDVPILVVPLGKAFGCFGAMVAGSDALIENIIQFARTYIYTTAIPPALAHAAMVSLHCVSGDDWRREKLFENVAYFIRGAANKGICLQPSESPIQSVVMGAAERAMELSKKLLAKGFLISAIRPPTVPPNTSRLRITLTCEHTRAQMDGLLDALCECQHAVC